MKASDRAIILGFAIAGMIAAFWFMALSPKRDEVAKLDEEITALRTSVAEQEQLAAYAEEAREGYQLNYRRMVTLGKAVPEGEDTASLFVELEAIADRSGADFTAIRLESEATAAPTTPAAAAAGETEADTEGEAADSTESAANATSAPATEAAVALLPIGAAVGPAGLPVMPYAIDLKGDFFELADFMEGVDELVSSKRRRALVDGRLVTIDGFALTGDEEDGFPKLDAALHVTTFVTPSAEGLTAGATPTGPALTATPAAGAPATTTTTTP